MVSRRRRVVFAAAVTVSFFFFATVTVVGLEQLGLIDTIRLDDAVYYPPIGLLRKVRADGQKLWRIRDRQMVTSRFAVNKPSGSVRLVVSGGSFMMGSPYVSGGGRGVGYGGIPSWMEAQLKTRFPNRQFEVINAAAGAQDSSRVREVAKQMISVSPDIMVVGIGNNDGTGPATPFNVPLHRWAVYRLLKSTVSPGIDLDSRRLIPPKSPDSSDNVDRFQRGLTDIVEMTAAANIRLVLVTLPINLRWQSISVNELSKPSDPFLDAGGQLLAAGRVAEAITECEKSKNTAWAARCVGDARYAQGEYEAARRLYRVAVQLHPAGTRPDFNTFVRQFGGRSHVLVVDAEQLVDRQSRTGIADPDIFFDNCHMVWQGYALVGRAIVDALCAAHWVDNNGQPPQPALTDGELISANGWEQLEAFTTDFRHDPRLPNPPHLRGNPGVQVMP